MRANHSNLDMTALHEDQRRDAVVAELRRHVDSLRAEVREQRNRLVQLRPVTNGDGPDPLHASMPQLRREVAALQAGLRDQAGKLARFKPAATVEMPAAWLALLARMDSLERRMDILVEETKRLHDVVEGWGMLAR